MRLLDVHESGPDVTETFCQQNGLQCVIRSHEAPVFHAEIGEKRPEGEGRWLQAHAICLFRWPKMLVRHSKVVRKGLSGASL